MVSVRQKLSIGNGVYKAEVMDRRSGMEYIRQKLSILSLEFGVVIVLILRQKS